MAVNHLNVFTETYARHAADAIAAEQVPPRSLAPQYYRAYAVRDAPAIRGIPGHDDPLVRIDATRQAIGLIANICLSTAINPVGGAAFDPAAHTRWQALLSTLCSMLYEPISSEPEVVQGVRRMPAAMIERLYALYESIGNLVLAQPQGLQAITWGDQAVNPIWAEIADLRTELGFPRVVRPVNRDFSTAGSIGTPRAVACTWALCLYLAGRPVGVATDAFLNRRPTNLATKFYGQFAPPELTGEWRPNIHAATWIGTMWELSGRYRSGMILNAIPLASEPSDSRRGPTGTMIALLAGAQMGFVDIINTFVTTYPFVGMMPELQGCFAYLALSIRMLDQHSPAVRRYIKVIMRDLFKGFDSKRLAELIGLAIVVLGRTTPSLLQYAIHTCPIDLERSFDNRLLELRGIPQVGAVAQAPAGPLGGGVVAGAAPAVAQGVAAGPVFGAQALQPGVQAPPPGLAAPPAPAAILQAGGGIVPAPAGPGQAAGI